MRPFFEVLLLFGMAKMLVSKLGVGCFWWRSAHVLLLNVVS
ncbi:hypothetical protein HanXRQr2_Chr16g0740341 [Helianthus annuus]|uniref:Uncharacterized protein n=1 Tax=Helianthus annuus TaxID=4232 RepID=A0A9K3DQ30_HELAN|nr:hypothetical protein HanXRQr2_Chr16g0740341 [Helianthus annuus]